jgi:hypothetical protein
MLLGTGLAGVASAIDESEVGMEELGLKAEVMRLIREGRTEEARSILNEHNVEHAINTGSLPNSVTGSQGFYSTPSEPSVDNPEENGLGTEGRYSNNSEYHTGILNHGGGEDLYIAFGNITLGDRRFTIRDALIVDDGMGIFWADSDWTGHRPDDEGVDYWSGDVAEGVSHEEYIPGDGVAGSVNLSQGYPGGTIGMNVPIEKIRNKADSVQFEYENTWSVVGRDISIGISQGALSVSTPLNVSTAWRNEEAVFL